jgi:hypothetical protein
VRWTGRLAYLSPSWTPTTPRTSKPRSPERLAPTLHDIRQVSTAIHAASTTLAALAAADHAQLRITALTGQLLAPVTEITPAGHTTVHFELAPADRIDELLTTYTEVTAASARAAQFTSAIGNAKTTRPQILTPPSASRPESSQEPTTETKRAQTASTLPDKPARQEQPGPVETILRQLGTTTPELLDQAAALDKATRHLITQATRQAGLQHRGNTVTNLNAAADTGDINRHVLARDLAHAQPIAGVPKRTASLVAAPERDDLQAEP